MASTGRTTTAAATPINTEAGVSSKLLQDVYGGHMEPYPNEQDMRADTVTGHLQDGAHIARCPDDDQDPMPAATNNLLVLYDSYSLDRGAMEPSYAAAINDAEFKGCVVTDGDGVVTEAPLPAIIRVAGCALPTTRRHSARLRCSAPSTMTPYTRSEANKEVNVNELLG
ncbi:Hypothetical predicted protein [Olea europaea subsp. europaea]|uniref:Uncharacterized protein n=1 Tax=Olea europaea subsp. europaea TaxID=158383 RepID=A0A8S0SYX2_OLEEU|nr:Hypothetical predicted protein [Olea europaea subsp. europaea]